MEPEIQPVGTKMLKKMSEKLTAKFPATTPSCSMVKVLLTASKPSERSITPAKRDEKERKGRGEGGWESKIEKPKDIGHLLVSKFLFLCMPEQKGHKT